MFTNDANLYMVLRNTNVQRARIASILLLLAAVLCAPQSAAAASLQEVQGFGSNPSNAKMFIYVPDKVAASPPILVAIHYCGGNANAYFTGTGYRSQADQYGFIVIYPQTTSSDGCFDVHSDATLKHDGGSDSAAIASMVRYTISKYAANASRVYVTGTSSGAMMTNVMLGAYPDIFRAGAAFAGVPYGCFAGASGWNSACANGQVTKTAQQWGDLVRAGYPGYLGPRPRVQLWHGDQDQTLNFHNFGEAIKQWTNVLGVSETPTTTESNAPQSGWTRTRYADSAGVVRVEAVLEAGMTHNLTVPAAEVIRFFGLNAAADPGGAVDAGVAGDAGSNNGKDAGSAADAAAGSGTMEAGTGSPSGGSAGGVSGDAGTGTSGRTDAGAAVDAGPNRDGAVTSGAGGATASPGSADAGQSAAAPVGVAGHENPDDDDATSSCSSHAGGKRGGGVAALMIVVLGATLRRRRRPASSDRERCGASSSSRGGTV